MAEIDTLLQQINKTVTALNVHKQIAEHFSEIIYVDITLIHELIKLCKNTYRNVKQKRELPENYINNISLYLNNIYSSLPFGKNQNAIEEIKRCSERSRKNTLNDIANKAKNLNQNYNTMKFALDVFVQLDFFENNIVLIGANGSGKTFFANKIKKTFNPNNGIVISAQRVLRTQKYEDIPNVSQTKQRLDESWRQDKTYKNSNAYNHIQDEFNVILRNLIADNATKGLKYSQESKKEIPTSKALNTNMDSTLEIWNSLISQREIAVADDHINIIPKTKEGQSYELVQMSDGEKVMLYLIAQVLQAPGNGFIIVDEPEIYLHKSILRKLWDKLEKQRQDCIFIYLTHDIEFATSRSIAKKVWIKSFIPPENWEFESIGGGLPEELLLEIIGSQKKILFCEGEKGGDESIYNILFPNFTITPVRTCKNVINYVRTFNNIENRITDAFGIIDADFREQDELELLEDDNIFSLDVAEIENLLLDEDFLKSCAEQLYNSGKMVKFKSTVLKKFDQDIEMQVSHYVSSKINYIFNNHHTGRGNCFNEVAKVYEDFTNQIDINKWHTERKDFLKEAVDGENYTKIIKLYNNKGLIVVAEKAFDKGNFRNFAIKHLKNNIDAQNELKKHFPQKMLETHDN